VTYPLITLSTRAQVDSKGEHRSITAAFKKIVEKEGIAGLYAGLKSALFGIGVTNGNAFLDLAKGEKGFIISGTSGLKSSLRMRRSKRQDAVDP